MGRLSASRSSLRFVAAIAAAALWAWPGGSAAPGAEAGSDAAFTCGDVVSCVGGCGCDGPGGSFCGNLVTPKGGCASGYEMWWFGAKYMLWQRDGFSLPPLATMSDPEDEGILGGSSTTIVGGAATVSDGWRSGFGLEMGCWLNPTTGWAIGADYFNGGRDSYGFSVGPSATQAIARPFANVQTNSQDAVVVNTPGVYEGAVGASVFDDFQGAGAWMEKCVWSRGNGCTGEGSARVSLLGGYRYYHQDSLIFIRDDFQVVEGAGLPDVADLTIVHEADKFAGRNEFHGAEVGVEGRLQRCRWWCEGLAAVAFGGTRRVMFVEGGQVVIAPNFTATQVAGDLLVSAETNFGRYTDNECQAIPRFRLGGGWQLNEWVGIKFVYNLVIWNIVQAADALPTDLEVDLRNVPQPAVTAGGGPQPAFPGFRERTMVAHGLDLGLELSF